MLPTYFSQPLYKTVQLCCILGAALAISACSDSNSSSSGGQSSATSTSSSEHSSSSSSESSSSSSSSSSEPYIGDADTGEVVMKSNMCAGCHTDREDGTFGGFSPFNVNNLLAFENPTQASLADYIEAEMPDNGNPGNCGADCAADVAAYLWTYKRENLVTDGGFEGTNVTGWSPWNSTTLALTTSRAYAGLQSLEATNRNNADQFAVYGLNGSVEANTTYKVRAMAMHTGEGPDTLRLGAKVQCAAGTAPEGHNQFPWLHNLTNVPANQWTLLHDKDLELPDCELEDVAIFFEGTTAGVNVYLDEVYVTPPTATEE